MAFMVRDGKKRPFTEAWHKSEHEEVMDETSIANRTTHNPVLISPTRLTVKKKSGRN
jgi:hypothetical protein